MQDLSYGVSFNENDHVSFRLNVVNLTAISKTVSQLCLIMWFDVVTCCKRRNSFLGFIMYYNGVVL